MRSAMFWSSSTTTIVPAAPLPTPDIVHAFCERSVNSSPSLASLRSGELIELRATGEAGSPSALLSLRLASGVGACGAESGRQHVRLRLDRVGSVLERIVAAHRLAAAE